MVVFQVIPGFMFPGTLLDFRIGDSRFFLPTCSWVQEVPTGKEWKRRGPLCDGWHFWEMPSLLQGDPSCLSCCPEIEGVLCNEVAISKQFSERKGDSKAFCLLQNLAREVSWCWLDKQWYMRKLSNAAPASRPLCLLMVSPFVVKHSWSCCYIIFTIWDTQVPGCFRTCLPTGLQPQRSDVIAIPHLLLCWHLFFCGNQS